jgi:alkylhydroperoxidase family enzyme
MKDLQALADAVRSSILETPGDTDPALRRAVKARAAAEPGDPLPAELVPLVDKIARHAYRVTGEDLAAVQQAGYSEDALFEVVLSAALGASRRRLERGLAALRGAQEDSTCV